jgi:NNP family nitrate/nitrite transporter-like MFS transporter
MAITTMFFFGLCLKMANGATYSIVPFVNSRAVGSIAGIVGAGGNVGAMLIGFLFKSMPYAKAFLYLGGGVLVVGLVVTAVRLFGLKRNTDSVVASEAQSMEETLAA